MNAQSVENKKCISFRDLPKEALDIICCELCPRELGTLSMVEKAICEHLMSKEAEESVWKLQCKKTFCISHLQDSPCANMDKCRKQHHYHKIHPHRQHTCHKHHDCERTFRHVCIRCHKICVRYGTIGLRMLRAWSKIRGWLRINAPDIAGTLLPGVLEEELDEFTSQTMYPMPMTLRALYAVVNGQNTMDTIGFYTGEDEEFRRRSYYHGVLGGMQMYDYISCLHMIPLHHLYCHAVPCDPSESKRELAFNVFTSSTCHKTLQYVSQQNTTGKPIGSLKFTNQDETGIIAVSDDALDKIPEWLSEAAKSTGYFWSENDSLVVFLERYSDHMLNGQFNITKINDAVPWSVGINIFPSKPPLYREEITEAIRVGVSTILVPFHSRMNESLFAYKVRLSLLSLEEQKEQGIHPPILSVQLMSRHWIIRDSFGAVTADIEGEGVIGLFPILKPTDAEVFSYQSCTQSDSMGSSMVGEFVFVEGSKKSPGRRTIVAKCPSFELKAPDVIF